MEKKITGFASSVGISDNAEVDFSAETDGATEIYHLDRKVRKTTKKLEKILKACQEESKKHGQKNGKKGKKGKNGKNGRKKKEKEKKKKKNGYKKNFEDSMMVMQRQINELEKFVLTTKEVKVMEQFRKLVESDDYAERKKITKELLCTKNKPLLNQLFHLEQKDQSNVSIIEGVL